MSGCRVTEEARALGALDLEGLRAEWRARIGPPPKVRSPELIRHILAWRLQAAALGGLAPETKALLKRTGAIRDRGAGLGAGVKLVREWRGQRYEVEAVEGAFRYDGTLYDSLSEIARKITGTRWNGPRFFGARG